MKIIRVVALMVALCLLSVHASAQAQEKGRQVDAKAKLQVFFSELETQWLRAVEAKDPAALNGIVSDDFHVRTAAPPGNPISRAEWLLGVFGRKILSSNLRQLAVRELNPQLVIVSFVETETYQQSATPQTEDRFVVDVWMNNSSGDNWRCTDRYLSEVRGATSQK